MLRRAPKKSTLFGGALLLVVLFALAPAAVASGKNSPVAQEFSVSLQPYNTAFTPQGYLFGSGTWSGTINPASTQMNYIVTLIGAMPNTQYIAKVSFFNSTGGVFARSYGLMTTDGQGDAVFAAKSQIFAGTVQIALGLSDKTNFSPPLQVLISDPVIGSDAPT